MPKKDHEIYLQYLSRDINSVDSTGITPLMWAASDSKRTPYVAALIEKKANINFNHYGTALSTAARVGNLKSVRQLLAAKANPDITIHYYQDTALTFAIVNGHTECAQFLINYGANIELSNTYKTALDYAIEMDNADIIALLLKHRAIVKDAVGLLRVLSKGKMDLKNHLPTLRKANALDVINKHDENLLIFFAKAGNIEALKQLIREPVKLNTISGYFDNTALTYAIQFQHTTCAEFLIKNKAALEVTYNKKNALDYAIETQNKPICKLLIEYKATVHDSIGLLSVLSKGKMDLQNHMPTLKNAMAIHTQNKYGQTLLSYFTNQGDVKSIGLLIEANADLNKLVGHFKDQTALTLAINNTDIACTTSLIEAKADLKLPWDGRPLDALNRNLEIINLLLYKGATSNNPENLLMFLIKQSNHDINTYIAVSLFLEQQKQASKYKSRDARLLSVESQCTLQKFFASLPEPTKNLIDIHAQLFAEIDRLNPTHQFPTTISHLIVEYDGWKYRLFQPRTLTEIEKDKENLSKQTSCALM